MIGNGLQVPKQYGVLLFIWMTDAQQRSAAKNFADYCKGKGYEKAKASHFGCRCFVMSMKWNSQPLLSLSAKRKRTGFASRTWIVF